VLVKSNYIIFKLETVAEAWQQLLRHSVASDDGTIFKKLSREEIASILQWMPVV